MPSLTFHLARAKFFSIWAQTPSLMFLSEAALPEILGKWGGVSIPTSPAPTPGPRPPAPTAPHHSWEMASSAVIR